MDPKYLLELKNCTEKALNEDPPDGLMAITAAWTLWEAVRRRMLVMACKREGWTVAQARRTLAAERINNERFVKLFEAITNNSQWEGSLPMAARRLWPGIVKIKALRRRIINGTSRIGDVKLQKYAWDVLRFINSLRDHSLGDPLKELPKKSGKTKSDRSLKNRIKKV